MSDTHNNSEQNNNNSNYDSEAIYNSREYQDLLRLYLSDKNREIHSSKYYYKNIYNSRKKKGRPNVYPEGYRQRILDYFYGEGEYEEYGSHTWRDTASYFNISLDTLRRFINSNINSSWEESIV